MKKTKEQRGITLVALIITIVVLLILAIVSIGAVQNSGIIGNAKNATTEYNNKEKEEEGYLKDREGYIKGYETLVTGKDENNKWAIRGLTVAKTDVTYFGISNDEVHTAEVFLDKNGEIQLKLDGNEQPYTSNDTTVASEDTLVIANEEIELKFIDNGNAAEIRMSGSKIGTLYVVDDQKILPDFTYSNGIITGLSAQGVQKVTSGKTELVIPTEIDGQAITGIAERAFCALNETANGYRTGYNQITKITIPGTIQSIGDYAFAHNSSLKTLIYQEGVKTAGKYSFLGCKNLEYVELPSTIEYVVEENKDHGQGEGSGSKLVIKINKTANEIRTLSQTTAILWNGATIKDKDGNVVTKSAS